MAPNELLGLQPVAGQRALRSSAHPAQSDRQWPLGPGTANLTWAQEIQGLLACVLTPRARQELWHSFTTSVGIPQNTAADREMARALYVSLRVLVGRTLAAAAALERSLDRDSVERRRAGRAGFRPRTRHLPRGARRGAEAVPPLPLGGPGGGGTVTRADHPLHLVRDNEDHVIAAEFSSPSLKLTPICRPHGRWRWRKGCCPYRDGRRAGRLGGVLGGRNFHEALGAAPRPSG
jgi:hypothetical protein